MSRPPLVLAALLIASCGGARPAPRPSLFPGAAAWKTIVGDFVVPPLATDGKRLFVATRDAALRALDPATGEVQWRLTDLPGRVSAGDGALLLRAEDGRLTSLQPRTGVVRWSVETGVAGELPATIDVDRALVAGKGLAAVELASGKVLWSDATGAVVTAPPVRSGARLLSGEADGQLRARSRDDGRVLWHLETGRALLAPPLVDERRGRIYVGTTQKRIVEASLADGSVGWRWRVGADVADAGLLLPGRVLFASFDAVLYSLRRGGNLDWRGALPSRPLSGPLLVSGQIVVACLENELVAFAPDTGARLGTLRTPAEIRTRPLVAGSMLVLGLRDRSVVAYALPPEAGPGSTPPVPAPRVEPTPPAR